MRFGLEGYLFAETTVGRVKVSVRVGWEFFVSGGCFRYRGSNPDGFHVTEMLASLDKH